MPVNLRANLTMERQRWEKELTCKQCAATTSRVHGGWGESNGKGITLAPVNTIVPDTKMRSTTLGFITRWITNERRQRCRLGSPTKTSDDGSAVTHPRFIQAELSAGVYDPLQANGELDVAAAHDVLDLGVSELGVEAELPDDARVLVGESSSDLAPVMARLSTVVLGLRMRMMTAAKRYKSSYESASEQHDVLDHLYLGVVLGVAGMQRDRLQVEPAAEVDGGDDVPERISYQTGYWAPRLSNV
jgi:hypothetical protein